MLDERDVDGLLEALCETDYTLRKTAIWALSKIGDPKSLGPLLLELRKTKKDDYFDHNIIDAFLNIGEPAVDFLADVLEGRQWYEDDDVVLLLRCFIREGNKNAIEILRKSDYPFYSSELQTLPGCMNFKESMNMEMFNDSEERIEQINMLFDEGRISENEYYEIQNKIIKYD